MTAVNYLPERNQNRPGDDPIFTLHREATLRRHAGERIINATVGVMLEDDGTLAVLPSVVEALREVPPTRGAAYAPIAGIPEFLSAVTEDLLGGSPLLRQAVAVATPGGTGAIRLAVTTFLERHQAIVTSSFYWNPYAIICNEHERSLRTFNMFEPGGTLDLASFERTLDAVAEAQGRLLVLLNDPCHNPTGYSLDDEEWSRVCERLAAFATRVPLAVLVDVAYLTYAREPRRCIPHLATLTDKALVLFAWSASKGFAQYGLRVGALIACTTDETQRDAIQRALGYACRGTWSNCNAAGQIAIARCISDTSLRARVDAERDRLRTLLASRVETFNAVAHAKGLRHPRYDGGFFVTVFASDARAAAERLRTRGVFVVPQPGALRLALSSVPQGEITELVHAVSEAIG